MEGSIKPQAVKYWCYALAYTDLKQVLVGVILVEHTGDSKKYTRRFLDIEYAQSLNLLINITQ